MLKSFAERNIEKKIKDMNATGITHSIANYDGATNMKEGLGKIASNANKEGFFTGGLSVAAIGTFLYYCNKYFSKTQTKNLLKDSSNTYDEIIKRINQALKNNEKPDINDVCEVYYYNGNHKDYLYGYTHEELEETFERHLNEKNIQ